MSKKKPKFSDIWINQSNLGKQFNLSAVAIGKKLKKLGLREANNTPSSSASSAPLRFKPPNLSKNSYKL